MKKYTVYADAHEIIIEGETMIEAIENNFETIARKKGVGNGVGYCLLHAEMEYNTTMSTVVLTIEAQGSEALVGYNEDNDPPQTYEIFIQGVSPEELPEKYVFEFKEDTPFTPFEDKENYNESCKLGIALGLINVLANNYSQKKDRMSPFSKVMTTYPNAIRTNSRKVLDMSLKHLPYCNVKDTAITKKIRARIDELIPQIPDSFKADGLYLLLMGKTEYYFKKLPQISKITELRKKTGKTQAQIADDAGISIRQYQRVENGDSNLYDMAYEKVIRIAQALNIDPDKLVKKQTEDMEISED